MELAGREYQILQTAIAALQATAGLKTVEVRPLSIDHPNPRADAVLTITLNGHKQLFVAAIKTIDRHLTGTHGKIPLASQLAACSALEYPASIFG